MKVEYNKKQYELKYSFRALMIYENITGKSFNPKTLGDIIILFYSILCSSAKGETIDFDKFMDWLDEHPQSIQDFSTWLTNVFNLQSVLSPEQDAIKDEKVIETEFEKN